MLGHNYGMAGFIKQLVDEQAAFDATRKHSKGQPQRASKFDHLMIANGIIYVKKAKE
jgi:hypothetical protein